MLTNTKGRKGKNKQVRKIASKDTRKEKSLPSAVR